MKNKKSISVLLPVRNGEKYICQAIHSILQQTYEDFELIVVNDGSSDNTIKLINSFSDTRIKIVNTTGVGLVTALNLGLKQCSGDYIARMDADDISMPNRFETQVKILSENENIGIVCSDIEVIDEEDNVIGTQTDVIMNNRILSEGLTLQRKMKPIIHPSVMIRKHLLEFVGGYREFNAAEDKDLWLRLLPFTTFYRVPKILLKYRITQDGVSRSKYIQQKANSMLSILNYEVVNDLGIDLYVEAPDQLEHFYKTFVSHISKSKKDFDHFQDFKEGLLGKGYCLKIFGLSKIIFDYRLIRHLIFARFSDRKRIEMCLPLINELNINQHKIK